MPTPGFPVGTLTENGDPAWLEELSGGTSHHQVHVVRGLSPEEAVTALGATVMQNLEPGELPEAEPDGYTSLGRVAVDEQDDDRGVLVAGRNGEWTFVYDDSPLGDFPAEDEAAVLLSRDGRIAASSSHSINADTDFHYAFHGRIVTSWSEPHHAQDVELPAQLQPAVKAAGVYEDPAVDLGANLRILCALAGLTWTVPDLRSARLLVARRAGPGQPR